MRVIAGSARRLQLKTVDSLDTRPTTDRIKETLFNILNSDLPGSVFLDLFSGSGGIGIEALSRGAKKAYFVENDKRPLMCIKDNLANTNLIDKGEIINRDAVTSISLLEEKREVFDFIFMDPPYGKELEKEVLIRLQNSSIVNEDTLIIVESQLDEDFSYVSDLGYSIIKTKEYKTNKHTFISI